ncbi:response regulator transcription factor, partial [Pararhodobacter sp. SW119]|uniref:response regulator n=1 Tax=Pararhodobacter sp. SW119 TaxID=2780075 RepID=UPI001FD83145
MRQRHSRPTHPCNEIRRAMIFAIEDDQAIRTLLSDGLEAEGFDFRSAGSVNEFLALDSSSADLFLVDLGLPDGNGLSVVRRLREQSDAGIIVLTGRSEETEQILGLELGADDYVTKPFRPRELTARINAVLRRLVHNVAGGAPTVGPLTIDHAFGEYRVSLVARRVLTEIDEEIALTSAEFDLLAALLSRRGHALTREQILYLMKGRDWELHDRAVDGVVSRLRRKLPSPPGHPPFIRTI